MIHEGLHTRYGRSKGLAPRTETRHRVLFTSEDQLRVVTAVIEHGLVDVQQHGRRQSGKITLLFQCRAPVRITERPVEVVHGNPIGLRGAGGVFRRGLRPQAGVQRLVGIRRRRLTAAGAQQERHAKGEALRIAVH